MRPKFIAQVNNNLIKAASNHKPQYLFSPGISKKSIKILKQAGKLHSSKN